MKTYNIVPVGKPRMTQADRWQSRKRVNRYWAYKLQVRKANIILSESGDKVMFVMPMPKSWSVRKKNKYAHLPHQQKPDLDNLIKGLWDAVFEDDSHVWQVIAEKVWGHEGQIIVD